MAFMLVFVLRIHKIKDAEVSGIYRAYVNN
jgi:hypothetical protein